MNKNRERREIEVHRLAYELAESGTHTGWLSVEVAIRQKGYPEARRLLDNRELREQLDLICQRVAAGAKPAHG